jgi:hypothetical protein
MSAQFKLDQNRTADQEVKEAADQKKNKRPNIDHLLKRISLEKKAEKKNNIIVIIFGIIAIAISSFLFL